MSAETDDLTMRLRAADPACADAAAGRAEAEAAAAPGRAALRSALRRRSGRRRLGAGAGAGGLLAAAAGLAVALGATTAGTVAAKPTTREIVARAADASALDPGSILTFTSDVRVRANGSFTQRRTTWLRLDAKGRTVGVRVLVTAASGAGVVARAENVMRTEHGRTLLESYDPRSDRVETVVGSMTPSLVSQAHRLLLRAQAGDRDVRLLGETRADGRRAYRLLVSNVDEPSSAGEQRELLVDAQTYEPIAMTIHDEGVDVEGRPFRYDFSERIVGQSTLVDSPANREQLRMHGPTG